MDTIPVITRALTMKEIMDHAIHLSPKKALGLHNGTATMACTSGVYARVMVGGETHELSYMKWKDAFAQTELIPCSVDDPAAMYAAIYSRVSTAFQVDNGWSAGDQVERGILTCLERDKKWAFRVFNDQGMSGRLPMNDAAAIQRMRKQRRKLYEQIFGKVFLDEKVSYRFSPAMQTCLRAYMVEKAEEIVRGATGDQDGVDVNAEDDEAILPILIGKKTLKPTYRPALTYMLQAFPVVHHLLISDQSRICRSASLFMEIVSEMREKGVRTYGTMSKLDWMNEESLGGDIIAYVMSRMAESQLEDVLLGSLRGIQAMLMAGKPHGQLPFWLTRESEQGERVGVILNERINDVYRIIDLYKERDAQGDERGFYTVAARLQQEGILSPTGNKRWSAATVKDILTSDALRGTQQMFGVEWHNMPPVLDTEAFFTLQRRVKTRCDLFKTSSTSNQVHLLSGVLRCVCGKPMVRVQNVDGFHTYQCSELRKGREDLETQHVTINQKRADNFFDALMSKWWSMIIEELKMSDTTDSAIKEMNRLSDHAARIAARMRETESIKKPIVEAALDMMGVKPTDADYAAHLMYNLGRLMSKEDDYQEALREKQEAERRVSLIRASMENSTPVAELERMAERGKNWMLLCAEDRCQQIHDFFESMPFEGEIGSERIVCHLRSASKQSLAPIPILYAGNGMIRPKRMLPNPDEWVYQVLRVASRRMTERSRPAELRG